MPIRRCAILIAVLCTAPPLPAQEPGLLPAEVLFETGAIQAGFSETTALFGFGAAWQLPTSAPLLVRLDLDRAVGTLRDHTGTERRVTLAVTGVRRAAGPDRTGDVGWLLGGGAQVRRRHRDFSPAIRRDGQLLLREVVWQTGVHGEAGVAYALAGRGAMALDLRGRVALSNALEVEPTLHLDVRLGLGRLGRALEPGEAGEAPPRPDEIERRALERLRAALVAAAEAAGCVHALTRSPDGFHLSLVPGLFAEGGAVVPADYAARLERLATELAGVGGWSALRVLVYEPHDADSDSDRVARARLAAVADIVAGAVGGRRIERDVRHLPARSSLEGRASVAIEVVR